MSAARSSGETTRIAPKHKLNVLKKAIKGLGGRVIDQRTTLGKALAQWRKEPIEDLGGPEAVSTQKQALIELAVRTKLLLDSIDTWLLKQPSLVNARRRAVLPVVLQRQHLAESLARSLTQLGLERRARMTAADGEAALALASSVVFEKLVEKLLPLGQEDFIRVLDILEPRIVGEPLPSMEGENTSGDDTQAIIEYDGRTKNQHSISTDGLPVVATNTDPTIEDKVGIFETAIRRLGKALVQRASLYERRVGQTDGDSLMITTLELALKKEIDLAQHEVTEALQMLESPERLCGEKLLLGLSPYGDDVPGEPPPPVSTEPNTSPPVLILPDTMQEVYRLLNEFGLLAPMLHERGFDVRVFPREQAPGY